MPKNVFSIISINIIQYYSFSLNIILFLDIFYHQIIKLVILEIKSIIFFFFLFFENFIMKFLSFIREKFLAYLISDVSIFSLDPSSLLSSFFDIFPSPINK